MMDHKNAEISLMSAVFRVCGKDFRRACREWKKRPCPATKIGVNKAYRCLVGNAFVKFSQIDVEEAAQILYKRVMGSEEAHIRAMERCERLEKMIQYDCACCPEFPDLCHAWKTAIGKYKNLERCENANRAKGQIRHLKKSE